MKSYASLSHRNEYCRMATTEGNASFQTQKIHSLRVLKTKAAHASFLLQAGLMLWLLDDIIRQAVARSIYIWDESIYALNALEMSQTGRLLVYTAGYQLDHHNSKPPLVIWLQAFFISVIGPSELAVRLPSFLALVGTLALFLLYSQRITGSIRTGLIACMAMLTCSGLMKSHVFLSGDLDGVLCFFATGIFLERLLQLHKGKPDNAGVYRMGAFFLLACFTKSTAILFVLPPLVASLLISRQFTALLKLRATWITAGASLLFITAYYVVREWLDAGYWQVVWHTEFVRVGTNIQPWLQFPFRTYWDDLSERLFKWQLRGVFVLLPCYLLLPRMKMRGVSFHAALMAALYILGISLPESRIAWYAAPAYPLLCFLLAILLAEFTQLATSRIAKAWQREAVILLLLLPLFAWWAVQTRDHIRKDVGHYEQPEYAAAFTKQLLRRHPEQQRITILEAAELPRFFHAVDAIRWYVEASAVESGKTKIEWHPDLQSVKPGDTVVSWHKPLFDSLKKRYQLLKLSEWAMENDTVRCLVIR